MLSVIVFIPFIIGFVIVLFLLGLLFVNTANNPLLKTIKTGLIIVLSLFVMLSLIWYFIWYPKEKHEREQKQNEAYIEQLKKAGFISTKDGWTLPKKVEDTSVVTDKSINPQNKPSNNYSCPICDKIFYDSHVTSKDYLAFEKGKNSEIIYEGIIGPDKVKGSATIKGNIISFKGNVTGKVSINDARTKLYGKVHISIELEDGFHSGNSAEIDLILKN